MRVFMACGAINPANPYLWLTLGGLLAGGGLSFLLCPAKRRKTAVFAVMLSFAIIFTLASLAIADFSFEKLSFRLYWLGISMAAGYLGLLFWKIIGIPLFFIFVVLLSSTWYSFSYWTCAKPGFEICTFSILSEGEGFIRVEYTDAFGKTDIDKIDGEKVFVRLEMITVPEYFFILGSDYAYRFRGFSSTEYSAEVSDVGRIMSKLHILPGFSYEPDVAGPISFSPSVENKLIFNKKVKPEVIRIIE